MTFKETEPTYSKEGLVNLPKLAYVGNVIKMVHYGQTTPFCLKPHPVLQQFILTLPYLEKTGTTKQVNKDLRANLKRSGSMPSNVVVLHKSGPKIQNKAIKAIQDPRMSASQNEIRISVDEEIISFSKSKRRMSFLPNFKMTKTKSRPLLPK